MADEKNKGGQAAPNPAVQPRPSAPAVDPLKALQDAMAKGDLEAVLKLAGEAKKAKSAQTSAKDEATKKQRDELIDKVKKDFQRLVQAYWGQIVSLVGEDRAILKCFIDKGQVPDVAIMKGAARAGGGGGGAGKTYEKSTDDLLEKFGSQMYKDTGKTTKQAFDEAVDDEGKPDGNKRYLVRKYLIKLDTCSK